MITFTLFLAIMNLSNVQQNLVQDYPGFKTESECKAVASKWLIEAKAKYGSAYALSAICVEDR